MCVMGIYERDFKQWRSTNLTILTKRATVSCLKLLNSKMTTTYDIGNSGLYLGQAQQMGLG